MLFPSLPLDPASWTLCRLSVHDAHVSIVLKTTATTACCPLCKQPADRIHSRYIRRLADLPWQDRAVCLQVEVRRFFCSVPDCPRRIFAERLASLTMPFARTTHRLRQRHAVIGFALGGEAGARLASCLAMPISPDTLLRRVRQAPLPERPVPRVLGVDDWAWRKGTRYGTILCDLEHGCVVDLLPDRNADTLAAWLVAHPGVEIVSRDRAGPYAQGIRRGAPQAVQIADRWHMLCNVREAVERLLGCHTTALREAAKHAEGFLQAPPGPTESGPVATILPTAPATHPPNRQMLLQQQRRERRCERYLEVRALHAQGMGVRGIARKMAISRRTVRRFLRASEFPERAPTRLRPGPVAHFTHFIRQRYEEGCTNAAELHRELKAMGLPRSYETVRRYLERQGYRPSRSEIGKEEPRSPARRQRRVEFPTPSARRASWWLLRPRETLEPVQQAFVEEVYQQDEEICGAAQLAREFVGMAQRREPKELADWLARAGKHSSLEMRGLAGGLRQDEAAVRAGLELPWSTSPVEGHINRLKMLKRQMFGRAGFDLLRRRVLHAN